MKSIILMTTFLFSFSTHAKPADVFFKNDPRFIKIDRVNQNGVDYVKLSGCKRYTQETTICSDIIQIEASQYSEMRRCFSNTIMLGLTGMMFGEGAAIIGGAFAIVGAIPGAGLMGYSVYKMTQADRLGTVYNTKIENDVDYISQDSDYSHFVLDLKKTLTSSIDTCDVATHTVELKTDPYKL